MSYMDITSTLEFAENRILSSFFFYSSEWVCETVKLVHNTFESTSDDDDDEKFIGMETSRNNTLKTKKDGMYSESDTDSEFEADKDKGTLN
ncbi:hypothetical protein AYI69_g5381 [Smittium culicis]|uniref:Uncharacterized protein n=1 Tax=Smittium culicis TaxID=133412 RepID=A0A1R1Y683_9FUNG|nr:hypothetical protein AYI69_g5381 [Smittium culicis]